MKDSNSQYVYIINRTLISVRSYQRHFKSWEWSKHDKWEPWKAVIYALRHETDEESSEKLRTLHDVIIP